MEGNIAADRYENGLQTGATQSLTAELDAEQNADGDGSLSAHRGDDCETKA